MKHGGRCKVCYIGLGFALFCPDCLISAFFQISSKKTRFKELSERCQALKNRCIEKVADKQQKARKIIQKSQKEKQLRLVSEQVQRMREAVWQKKQDLEQIQRKNEQRKKMLVDANQRLQNCLKELQQKCSELEVQQRISFWETLEMQSKVILVQKEKLTQLIQLFPLRISAFQSKSGIPIQVTIRNLPLPDPVNPTVDMFNRPEELNAALGYVLQFIDNYCRIQGVCKLHYHQILGSRSSLYYPDEFARSRRKNRSKIEEQSLCQMYIDPHQLIKNKQQLHHMSLLSFSPLGSSSQEGATAAAASPRSRRQNQLKSLALGLAQIYNTIVCIAQQNSSKSLAPNWSPFAWLQLIVEGNINCELHEALRPKDSGFQGVDGQWIQNLSDLLVSQDDGTTQSTDEGWDVVKVPMVPRPSSPADVEHWARAMFVDAQKTWELEGGSTSAMQSPTSYQAILQQLSQHSHTLVDQVKRVHNNITKRE
eukprot:TRINITY_DN299_c0_g2_i1.p1 TRINITY_DN299_c0_g2~~TRINITY_DN299_c0_g2_i1.p1  ORF type:complete len:481 (+),score=58.17 TRINITY_DN299_c0_g2_i1:138-1580(+)